MLGSTNGGSGSAGAGVCGNNRSHSVVPPGAVFVSSGSNPWSLSRAPDATADPGGDGASTVMEVVMAVEERAEEEEEAVDGGGSGGGAALSKG
jgi:hypothetical protein